MGRNFVVILFILFLSAIIVAYVYFKKEYFPKYNWREDYSIKSTQPYGINLLYENIKKLNTKVTVIYNRSYHLIDTNKSNTNFIFIGNNFEIDSAMALHLLNYVYKGNNVFIASNYSPLEVLRNFVPIHDTIRGYIDKWYKYARIQISSQASKSYDKYIFHYQYLKDTLPYNWSVYSKSYFTDTLSYYNMVPYTYLNDSSVNSFYVRHGKGKLIVHANPILFTNYNLLNKNGYDHTNKMLSLLSSGSIYFDDSISQYQSNEREIQSNPLKFLFSHSHLKWAWYLLLVTIILYLVFRSKREQRIIPILPTNQNVSINYTKAIGTLYFQKRGHQHIANELYTVFLSEIRSRYNIFTDISEEELIQELSVQSEISKKTLFNLFERFRYVRQNAETEDDDLARLYDEIEKYNKKRK